MAKTLAINTTHINEPLVRGKNLINNGQFDFWQRGTSKNIPAAAPVTENLADRWKLDSNMAVNTYTASRSSLATTSDIGRYSLTSTTTSNVALSAGDQSRYLFLMEGDILKDYLNLGKHMVLAFWVKSSVTGTYAVSFQNSTNTRCFVSTYTIDAVDTWEKKYVRFQFDNTGSWNINENLGLKISFTYTADTATYGTGTLDVWQNGNFICGNTQANLFSVIGNTFNLASVILCEDDQINQDFEPEFSHYGGSYESDYLSCLRYFYKLPVNQRFATGARPQAALSLYFFGFLPTKMRVNGIFVNISAATKSTLSSAPTANTYNWFKYESANFNTDTGTAIVGSVVNESFNIATTVSATTDTEALIVALMLGPDVVMGFDAEF